MQSLVRWIVAVLTLLAGSHAAAADFVWGSPVVLSTAGHDATAPHVALDDFANATVAWVYSVTPGTDVIQVTRFPLGGLPVTARTLSGPIGAIATQPQIVVDHSGNAVTGWTALSGTYLAIQYSRFLADGTVSGPNNLSNGPFSANGPSFAIDDAGNVRAAWDLQKFGTSSSEQTAQILSNGAATAPVDLAVYTNGSGPAVVCGNQTGDAAVVWTVSSGLTDIVSASRIPAGGSPTGPVNLSMGTPFAYNLDAAMDRFGNATIVWESVPPLINGIQLVRLRVDGTTTLPVDLAVPGQSSHAPRVAIDRNGNAIVVWYAWNGTMNIIQSVRVSSLGIVSAPVTLSAANVLDGPQVVIDQAGVATVVWAVLNGPIQATRILADGTQSVPVNLSSSPYGTSTPWIAVNSAGQVAVAWETSDGSNYQVQAVIGAPVVTVTNQAVPSMSTAGLLLLNLALLAGAVTLHRVRRAMTLPSIR